MDVVRPGSRRRLAAGAATGALLLVFAVTDWSRPGAPVPADAREGQARVTFGLAGLGLNALPLYLAAEETAQLDQLDIDMVSLGGGSRLAQALASGSVDVGMFSLDTVIAMIAAGQQLRVFYVGSPLINEWWGRPEIGSWTGLGGRSIAISGHGSFGERLTRHVLERHGLKPGRDVQLVPAGENAIRLAALRAGRVDAAFLAPPFTWQAEDLGFRRLGSQATEVPAWPGLVFAARERFLAEHPDRIRALLRAYVRAVRLARVDRETALRIIMTRLKYERRHAERAYAETVSGSDERGILSAPAMAAFWEFMVAVGEVAESWSESRFLDRRFIDTFDSWAPR